MVDKVVPRIELPTAVVTEEFAMQPGKANLVYYAYLTALIMPDILSAWLLKLHAVLALHSTSKNCVSKLPFGRLLTNALFSNHSFDALSIAILLQKFVGRTKLIFTRGRKVDTAGHLAVVNVLR